MYLNNKGSVLITTLIIFCTITTICMTCIGLHYSNSNIYNLEYKKVNMKEDGYGAIEIVHSNIFTEVKLALDSTTEEDVFNDYFLNSNFLNSIKNISNSDLKGVTVTIPNKINIDKNNGIIQFNINTKVKDDRYNKEFKASVKIKNPFTVRANHVKDIKSEENSYSHEDINNLIEVYDYKEI